MAVILHGLVAEKERVGGEDDAAFSVGSFNKHGLARPGINGVPCRIPGFKDEGAMPGEGGREIFFGYLEVCLSSFFLGELSLHAPAIGKIDISLAGKLLPFALLLIRIVLRDLLFLGLL